MHYRKHWMRIAAVAALTAVSAPAAFAAGDHGGGDGHGSDGHGHGSGHDFEVGEAAPNAEPDRTIEIVARDSMRFEPAAVGVQPGETVRFLVRNVGQMQHSFTLGSPEYHRRHDQEMMSMPAEQIPDHMDDSPNGVVVQPGQTETLTWRFSAGGPIGFACHIPGHYPAGMVGRLRIEQGDGGSRS